ncbi:MAG: B12-binding domain-containing radical SAM protein [Promethearchaeota archaeon]
MILLINPKTSKPSEVQTEFFREPNLGLLYLAAMLDLSNISVDILDLEQFREINKSELENIIREKITSYNIFGITSLTNTFHIALNVARIIKSQNKRNYVIMGGPHVTFLYRQILKDDLNAERLIDFICVGESEYSFLKLIEILQQQIAKKKTLEKFEEKINLIKGISYINSKGKIVFTGFPEEPINLESLPLPARYKLSQENYFYTVANIIVNRGCPNECSFCSRQNLFKKTRIRTIESIYTEINDILSLQTYNYMNFYDNINITRKFLRNFCKMFIENQIIIPWGCELRVDSINSEDAYFLKKAGCQLIATGIESANKTVLKNNFKYQDPEQVKQGIINLKKYDIAIQAYFILGLPGEQENTFYQTIDYIDSLPLDKGDEINYFVATPYPGSRLWDNKEIKIFEKDFKKYDCNSLIFETKDLTKEKLEQLYIIAKKIEIKYG